MWKHILSIIILLLVTACTDQYTSTPTSSNQATSTPASRSSLVAHFPQQINTPSAYNEALVQGELVLINGCLRVNSVNGYSILLIWRPGFSTRTEQGTVQIIDGTGKVTASVGDFVAVGGGFDDDPTWLGLTESLQEECPGPYYIVGETIKKIDRP